MRIRILALTLSLILSLSCLIIGGLPIQAQNTLTWHGTYYDNPYFQDPPRFSRVDSTILFDYGFGSPSTLIPVDNFSIRWGTDTFFQGGNYRFYVLADEEVRISLDFQGPLIDTFDNSQIGQVVSADASLSAGNHHIQIDFREYSGNAMIFFSFENIDDGISGPDFPVPLGTPTLTASPSGQSDPTWTANYYSNNDLLGAPVLTRQEFNVEENWGMASPAVFIPNDHWSATWTRNIRLRQGTYRVTASADDGLRVFINDIAVIDEWHISSGQTYVAEISLPEGVHFFRVEYFELGGLAYLDLNVDRIGAAGNNPTPAPDTSFATVITGQTGVHSQPGGVSGLVLTEIHYGDQYPALGINPARTWIQINVNGIIGWVDRATVYLTNINSLPVIQDSVPPTLTPAFITSIPPTFAPPTAVTTSYTVTATPYAVNVRSGPGTQFDELATMQAGSTARVIGRNASGTWWQVNYSGIVGWVSSIYAVIEPGANIDAIPITN